jgi:hypothetical protein
MATVNQIQTGCARFIDTHLATAFDGWQKAVVVGGSTLIVANLPNMIKAYSKNPVVEALGVYEPESNTVNIDALYNAFIPNLGASKIPITIPKIGTIKIGREEVDIICRYIKEA